MGLRRRLTLATAAAVGIAILIACVVAYVAVSRELHSQVDDALARQGPGAAVFISRLPAQLGYLERRKGLGLPVPGPRQGGPGYVQFLSAAGTPVRADPQALKLPVDSQDVAVAGGTETRVLRDVRVGGNHLRLLTQHVQGGGAIQLARPLNGVDSVLARLRWILALVIAGGIALAAGLGRAVSRNLLAPIAEVAAAAAHVGETEDLGRRIEVRSGDEVGRLAARFNTMLDRLQESRADLDAAMAAERRLVADASHELRTPVTSLRTNIEVLMSGGDRLSGDERGRLLHDVRAQTEELGSLVSDLIELARGDAPGGEPEPVRLDRLAAEAVERAQLHAPKVSFQLRASELVVDGVPERLGRALNNLLDNAGRHSPEGGTVEIDVDEAGVRVRDHGEGVDPDDLPHLFDRFYRGTAARGREGTGLGLAIVRQVAEQHGGGVEAANAPGGGACFTLRLPATPC